MVEHWTQVLNVALAQSNKSNNRVGWQCGLPKLVPLDWLPTFHFLLLSIDAVVHLDLMIAEIGRPDWGHG